MLPVDSLHLSSTERLVRDCLFTGFLEIEEFCAAIFPVLRDTIGYLRRTAPHPIHVS